MKFVTAILIYLCAYVCEIKSEKQLPSYINPCRRHDKEITKCWQNVIEKLRPVLAEKGMPEFNIPPIEPLLIDEIKLDQPGTASTNFNAILKNLKFDGPGNFTLSDTSANVDTLLFRTTLHFPHWNMEGDYNAKGKVLLFQFDSDGKITGSFDNIVANGTWQLTTFEKNGKKYLKIEKQTIDVHVEKIYLHLDDLFKGSKQLTENVNGAINNNIDVLYEDFKPILSNTIETIFKEYSFRVYSAIPFDVLYPL